MSKRSVTNTVRGLQLFYAKVSQLLQSKTGMNLFDFEVDSIGTMLRQYGIIKLTRRTN